MKSRKFSFDIPRLKLGPSKADNKALRDHLDASSSLLDSPPPTPKSVRPPLSPLAEAELRSACAYVLQNFKPSHIVFDEQHGNAQKQQLDYAAIKESVHREMEQSAPPLSKVTSCGQVAAEVVEDEEAEQVSSTKFSYKPDTATEDLFKKENDEVKSRRKSAMLRAEQLMSSAVSKSATLSPQKVSGTHLRSASSPQPATLAPPITDTLDRPRMAPRTQSMETTGSTPQTDTTDYPWSDKGSTAMTSAAPTPARSSKRTSSQALHVGMESGSVSKVEPVDSDWMRLELEKHKKAHEERLQHEKAEAEAKAEEDEEEKADSATDTTPTQTSTQTATPVAVKVPARKPVPHSRSASSQVSEGAASRQDSRVSEDEVRQVSLAGLMKDIPTGPVRHEAQYAPPPSRQVPSTPVLQRKPSRARSITRKVREYVQPAPSHDGKESQTAARAPSRARSVTRKVREFVQPVASHDRSESQNVARPPSRARSVTRKVRDYVRPGSAQGRRDSEDVPRSSSRAGYAARQVKEYFKPDTAATGSRKPSMDAERSVNRKRSMDSFRTAASEIERSSASSTDKWRSFKPFHRQQDSRSSDDVSRPGTSGSASESRGRSPQQSHAKPTVNLNRDLPPLPGLDQWKGEEADEAQPPEAPTPAASHTVSSATMTPKSHRSQRSRHEKPAVAAEPETGNRDEILAARMGSPVPSSTKHSLELRIPPQPTAPPPAPPPQLSANFSRIDDFDYEHLSPASPIEPSPATAEPKHERQRSKTIEVGHSADYSVKTKESALNRTSTTKPVFTGKATLVNYSRPAGSLSRKVSTIGRVAVPGGTQHARTPSDHTSRQASGDESARTQDGRFTNMAEITATKTAPQQGAASPVTGAAAAKVASKSKWWQRKKEGKEGKSSTWMDQVLTSGSRSGVLVANDVAGAPVVRY